MPTPLTELVERARLNGPQVVIGADGRTAAVILSLEDYDRLLGERIDPDDVRAVLAELARSSEPAPDVIAAADRLRANLAPELFAGAGATLSDPAAPAVGRHHARAGSAERAAALAAFPKSGTIRCRVLEAIAASGALGLTDHEIATRTHVYLYSAAPRRTELMHGGWVRDSGRRRTTPLGSEAVVWILTDEGAARLAARDAEDGAARLGRHYDDEGAVG